jgi:hypothetical protein
MQLKGGWLALLIVIAPSGAMAQSTYDLAATVFYESGGPLDMLVITPTTDAHVDFGPVAIGAGYEADIVSGASVAVVDAPSPAIDAISTATHLEDVRHTARGTLALEGDNTSLTGTYSYGTEADYQSHGMALAARAELFERNTAFDVSYARGWDRVCNLPIGENPDAVDRPRMATADGCFTDDPSRASMDLSIQTFQGAWTQAWSPILTTQLLFTAQLLNGYQGNPYRGVWLGRTSAQENHPENRARYAIGLDTRLDLEPLDGTVMIFLRGYRDTWDIMSVTGELAYDQSIGPDLRLRVRGRYYNQTSATFFSDDYPRMSVGQYFTGDRELSAMTSLTLGGRLSLAIPPGDDGMVLGFLSSLDISGKADVMLYDFSEFHYARASVPNTTAILVTLALEAVF